MKKITMALITVLLLGVKTIKAQEQELSASEPISSGCQSQSRGAETSTSPTIILTKEGNILSVDLLNYGSNCATRGFEVENRLFAGNNDTPSIVISVVPIVLNDGKDCDCPFNISYTVRGVEENKFYLTCWWFDGQVELTEGEPLVLEYKTEDVVIDGLRYLLLKTSHQAKLLYQSQWDDKAEILQIPSEIEYEGEKYTVTSINMSTFDSNNNIKKIIIPKTIRNTEFGSLGGITGHPFSACLSLETIEVEEGNPAICSVDGVLFNTDKTTLIGYPAAYPRESYTVPDGVKTAASGAFINSQYLKKIVLPDNMETLGFCVFRYCKSLEEVILPSNIKELPIGLFEECIKLKSVVIPEGVTSIGSSAFEGCSSLGTISMPESITTVGRAAFASCTSLKSATLSPNLKEIPLAMFHDCSKLAEVIIPFGITTIGNGAFGNCKAMQSFDLPESINYIDGFAFRDISNLKDIYCHSKNVPNTDKNAFGDVNLSQVTLHVPAASVSAYQAVEPWKIFKEIVALPVQKVYVKINETTFPDSNFRNWVLSQDYGSDGVLTDEELKNVTSLNISRLEIHDLRGIEYFTALKDLNCMTNELTMLDLSKNTALERLECRGNRLSTINLLENRKLRRLNCGGISYGNQITSLDVSRCTELDTLTCSGNPLTTLDVSKNTKLICLECYDSQLTSLDLSKNTALRRLHCNNNQLTMLDLSNNTELDLLQCSNNLLTTLDVTKNSALTYLTCMHNKLTRLCVSNNKSLEEIICYDNQLTTLDVSGCSALKTLSCTDNQLTTLDMSGCSALEELLCNDNQLTTLDLSENSALITLYCYQNNIKGTGMDALVESLPIVSEGRLYAVKEQNMMTTTQVATAKAKGWTTYCWNEAAMHWMEYAGIETAQDDYRPFVKEGKVWNVATIHPDDPSEAKDDYYDILRRRGRVWNPKSYIIEGDTVIGGVTYKKLLSDGKFVCGMREEEGRVYRHGWGWNPDSETLVYDFNAKLGDVFKNEDEDNEDMMVQVKRVSQVNINGQNRRCLEMHYYDVDEKGEGYDGGFADYWIEGIGCTGSPHNPFWWDVIGDYPLLLSCYDGEECIFNIEDFNAQIAKNPVDDIAYRPFVEEGKVWKVVDGDTSNPVQVVDYYYFDGDTIIDGKTCKQMMKQQYVNPDHPDYEHFPKSPFKVGTWYEEDKKVYFYDEGQQSMVLKYDFSLEANDTLKFLDIDGYISFIIGPKQTGGIDGFKGVYRDIRMCGDEGQSYHDTFWLEGVGCLRGPIRNPCNPILVDPVPEFLMSCTVGDEVIYLNDEYEDGATPEEARKKRFDFTHTIKIQPKSRIRRKNEQLLYGEYNDLKLGINLDPLDDDYQVSISDESGKVVYEKAINAGSIVGLNIDISAYTEGSYTVTVENSQESFTGVFETQTTGIKEIRNNKEEIRTEIYNLQGQRLSSLQKGLNIVNGQKIFVKD